MKREISIIFIGISLVLPSLCLASPTNENQSEEISGKTYVSGLVGLGLITSTGGGNYLTYSGRVGTGVYQDNSGIISLGAFVGSSSSSLTVSGVTVTGSTIALAAEIFSRRLFKTGLYGGARVGVGLSSASVSASGVSISGSGTGSYLGPFIGYEFLLGKNFNFSADVSWMTTGATTLTFTGLGSVAVAANSAALLQAGISYVW